MDTRGADTTDSGFWSSTTSDGELDVNEDAQPKNRVSGVSLRKGKWTEEEEVYTMKLIEAFIAGVLPLPQGTTLRSFLAEKLCCDPMRITKKFAGSNGIGKQTFTPTLETERAMEVRMSLERDIVELEQKFIARIESIIPNSSQSNQQRTQSSFPRTSSEASLLHMHGYRIAVPGHGMMTKEPHSAYNDLLSYVTLQRSSNPFEMKSHLVPPTTAPHIPRMTPSAVLASKLVETAKLPKQDDLIDHVFVDDKYRIEGIIPVKFTQTFPKKAKELVKKIEKTVRKPNKPLFAGVSSLSRASIAQQPGIAVDLQASALLLDFFRTAREKEEEDSADDLQSRTKVDSSYSINQSKYRVGLEGQAQQQQEEGPATKRLRAASI